MVHSGKHPIDPETGLCDICDRDAIEDIRRGRAPVRRAYRGPDNDDFKEDLRDDPFYPDNEDEILYDAYDDRAPRTQYRRRIRRVIHEADHEKPIYVRRRKATADIYPVEEHIPRRRVPVVEEVIVRRPIQPRTFYYVDQENTRVPRIRSPINSPRSYHVTRRRPINAVGPAESLPPITPPAKRKIVRVIRRTERTPSPVEYRRQPIQNPVQNERYRSDPRHRTYSDPEIVQPDRQITNEEVEDNISVSDREETPFADRKPVMYYIDSNFMGDSDRFDRQSQHSIDLNHSPLTARQQNGTNPKRSKVPVEVRNNPQVIRRPYRPGPPNENIRQNNSYRPTYDRQNNEQKYPTNRSNYQEEISPNSNRKYPESGETNRDPSVYYVRSSRRQ